MSNTIPIQYIGQDEYYRDGACGSGITLARGGVAHVPTDIAIKMMRHPTVWIRYTGPETSDAATFEPPQAKTQEEKQQDEAQALRDVIMTMTDKAGLKAYIKTHWGADVDGRMSVDALREKAVALFDQYGL